MTRAEIIAMFRTENPEITDRVISDALLHEWCKVGDKEICAITRCIVSYGDTISTSEDDEYIILTDHISKFYDIDEYPGGGVAYNGKRIYLTTKAKLDNNCLSWRSRSSGTPKEYFRRGDRIYFDRPIDSNAYDLTVDSILISDDFDDDAKLPYNGLTYLEPFHYGINKYLQWKAKEKIDKESNALKAKNEFYAYAKLMRETISGGIYGPIEFRPPCNH